MTLVYWQSYAALGDAGPWAVRLAAILQGNATLRDHDFEFTMLGGASHGIHAVVSDQVPRAIALGADLVSILIAPGDLAELHFTPQALAAELEDGVAALKATGCDVLLATCIEPRFGLIPISLRRRAAEFNSHVWSIARTHDAVMLDLWGARELQARNVWTDDLESLAPEGQRLLAGRAAHALGVPYFESRGQGPALDFGYGFPR